MADDTVTLALHGDVSLDAFADAVDRWRGLVEGLTRDHNVTWIISELSAGSATMTARAVGDEEDVPRATHAYLDVGRALAVGDVAAVPNEIREDAVALANVLRLHGDVEFMRFETAEAD